MSATATRHADLRIIRVDPQAVHSEVGAGFYSEFTFRVSTLMTRARKSVLLAPLGYGKSKIATAVAVELAQGGPVTAITSTAMQSNLENELRDAGHDHRVSVGTPHRIARSGALVPDGVLLVCLDSLLAPGAPHAAQHLVSQAAARASATVIYGAPTPKAADFINLLSTYCDDVTVINGC